MYVHKIEVETSGMRIKVRALKSVGTFVRIFLPLFLILGGVLGCGILVGLGAVFFKIVDHIVRGTELENLAAAWALVAVVGAFASVAGVTFGFSRRIGKAGDVAKEVAKKVLGEVPK